MIPLTGMVYICSAGETFDAIALNVYGDEVYASELLSANPKYVNVLAFAGGEELDLPQIDMVPDSSSAPWRQ